MLVGCEDGYDRQVNALLGLGFRYRDITICDRSQAVIDGLKDVNLGRCRLVQGDFLEVLNEMIAEGRDVSLVDFDSTMVIQEIHYKLVNLAVQHGFQLIMVAPRRISKALAEYSEIIARSMKMPFVKRLRAVSREEFPESQAKTPQKMKLCVPGAKATLVEYTKRTGLQVQDTHYDGVSKMFAILVN